MIKMENARKLVRVEMKSTLGGNNMKGLINKPKEHPGIKSNYPTTPGTPSGNMPKLPGRPLHR